MMSKMRWHGILATAGLSLLCACSTYTTANKVQVKMSPSGVAELVEQGDRTRVAIILSQAPAGPVMATIYQGTCADPNKKSVFAFQCPPANPIAPSSAGPDFLF